MLYRIWTALLDDVVAFSQNLNGWCNETFTLIRLFAKFAEPAEALSSFSLPSWALDFAGLLSCLAAGSSFGQC